MWNRISLSCVLFSISFSVFGEEEGRYLEWKPVPEAGSYIVEIKDASGKITREKTKATRFEVNLPPGVYEHRIGVLNKFGRSPVFSEWASFEVIVSRAPFINPDSGVKILKKKLGSSLTVKGKNFTEAMNATLLFPSGETIKVEFEFVNSKEIRIKTENLNLKEGSYTLSLENPRNKKSTQEGFLVLADSEEELTEIVKRNKQDNRILYPEIQWGPAFQSAILPGWGQSNQDKKYKRWIFPILIIGAIVYSTERLSAYNSSLAALNQSKTLNQSFFFMGDPALLPFATYYYLQVQSDYSNAVSHYEQFNTSLEIIALLYLLNVLDAALLGSTASKAAYESDRKIVPFFKTRKIESIQGDHSSNTFFPNSFEIGMKIFL
ncbi:LIC11435 family protein [Leptospira borgpetersenii]|uniref:DUF5683 domain-containing protein n=2 Tax=Leptospira borgpetersenii serovar Hardjo-bovis TaxID=338217 RepID=Q04S86_LEPBJ|nr:hypothetical protein [Leptospira borgpetersenii]ABJ76234.1 Hypothetical protein LBJ_1682 [Leptospira borgpetersenii serovar Hardjo-bovis str. JB197]ABJ79338.1 Hypothetical protein LBL_1906 [Leptospira borgpetersenii serovar Hardjo-bovis str. L550]AMX58656.1 hypothetical protein LBK6_10010 [Leptospira borgpetersenii serovar Hardjo]AMX61911.1 hypothetical protein LBK9_10040 [Leptospira borgpetersenii serovar Hardjo]AMX65153.1 hypothetical protein LBK30_10060 [Leptospira borgpetersenii serovar